MRPMRGGCGGKLGFIELFERVKMPMTVNSPTACGRSPLGEGKYWFDYETGMILNMGYPKYAQGWCYKISEQFIAASTASLVENRWVDRLLHTIASDDHRISCLYSFRLYQRNMTKKEYEYYQIRIKSNEEMGGLFTPQSSELPTNITCSDPDRKVIGYIGCNLSVDYRQVYISFNDINYTYETAIQCAETSEGTPYDNWVAGKQVTRTEHGVFWADLKCVDVRHWGADSLIFLS